MEADETNSFAAEKRSDWVSRRYTAEKTNPSSTGRENRTKAKEKQGGAWKAVKRLFIIVLVLAVLFGAVISGAMLGFIDNSTELIAEEYNMDFTSIIYYIDDETGQPVEMDRLYSEQNRIWVDLDNIPTNMRNAFIAIEDERFERHRGVDWKRTPVTFFISCWVMVEPP